MTTVFIVDDHDLFRAGVRAELPDDLEIVGDASEVQSAIEMIRSRIGKPANASQSTRRTPN